MYVLMIYVVLIDEALYVYYYCISKLYKNCEYSYKQRQVLFVTEFVAALDCTNRRCGERTPPVYRLTGGAWKANALGKESIGGACVPAPRINLTGGVGDPAALARTVTEGGSGARPRYQIPAARNRRRTKVPPPMQNLPRRQ